MPETPKTTAANSSRKSTAAAGWECDEPGTWRQLMKAEPLRPGKQHSFAWLNPVPLWKSRNDRVARIIGDPVGKMRAEWLAHHLPGDGDRTVDVPGGADG